MEEVGRQARIEALIAKWQEKLRLEDYDVFFAKDEPRGAAIADVVYNTQDMRAEIAIAMSVPPEYEEAEVVHEMLELLLLDLDHFMDGLVEGHGDKGLLANHQEILRHHVIHRLTSTFLGKHYKPFTIVPEH